MVKVLVCEDSEIVTRYLSRMCKEYGYTPVILAKDKDPAYVLENVGSVVREERPDCVVVDGLDGLWEKVIERIKGENSGILSILFTSDEESTECAREGGQPTFLKPDETEKMFEFIRSRLG